MKSMEMNSLLNELSRVASFRGYPVGDTPSPLTLARSGFIYGGSEFTVICPVCETEIEKFARDANPAEEHRKRSPDCPLAALVWNDVSLPTAITVSETARRNSPDMFQIYDSATKRSAGRLQTNDAPVATNASVVSRASSSSSSSAVGIDQPEPDYESLRCERRRRDTFRGWPRSAKADPKALARDGFFYTGVGDRVRCAFCRRALHSWETEDVPSEEHRQYYPDCPFVRNRDVANVRMENERRGSAEDIPPPPPPPPPPLGTVPASSQPNVGPFSGATPSLPSQPNGTGLLSADAFMGSTAVRAVLEMGFSVLVVKETIQQELDDTGEAFPNAETLLGRLLSRGAEYSLSTGAEYSLSTGAAAAEADETPESPEPETQPTTTASLSSSSSSASSTEQAASQSAIALSAKQAIGPTKKRKVRKKKSGAVVAPPPPANGSRATSTTTTAAGSGSEVRRSAAEATTSSRSAGTSASSTAAAAAAAAAAPIASTTAEVEESGDLHLDHEERALLEENVRLREARQCKVCMDGEVNTVFLPCGHLICCDLCSTQVKNCPLCRTFIRGTVKTFLS